MEMKLPNPPIITVSARPFPGMAIASALLALLGWLVEVLWLFRADCGASHLTEASLARVVVTSLGRKVVTSLGRLAVAVAVVVVQVDNRITHPLCRYYAQCISASPLCEFIVSSH